MSQEGDSARRRGSTVISDGFEDDRQVLCARQKNNNELL